MKIEVFAEVFLGTSSEAPEPASVFCLPVKNGCLFFVAAAWFEEASRGFLPGFFLVSGIVNLSFPSRTCVIFSPIALRWSSSRPYLMHTTLEGFGCTFGFGGDLNVPVRVFILRTFFDGSGVDDVGIMSGFMASEVEFRGIAPVSAFSAV
jgi:hypothetical protein